MDADTHNTTANTWREMTRGFQSRTKLPKENAKAGGFGPTSADESNPYIVFAYTPDRTRAGPQTFLADYKGHLQADAYGGYDGVYTRGNVIEVACWAHARRKFFDARLTDGRRAAACACESAGGQCALSQPKRPWLVRLPAKTRVESAPDMKCRSKISGFSASC